MASDAALDLLRSIDVSLKQLVRLMTVAKPKEIAPNSDLDGKYGDPIVNAKDPRDWTGPSMKGRRFSECSSEYLEMVASRLDFFAEKAEAEGKLASNGKPEAPYRRRDAARARGWAKRIRAGWKPTNGNGHRPMNDGVASSSEWPDESEPMSSDDISWG
jgi:hypothetical protein